ncbi:MAG: hypothetical protein ACI8QT_000484 [Halioglobus sp.]|jgi:hypothetical protein
MGDSDRLICILGMHRSGTSCVTGSLQNAGLMLGDCHTWNPHNKKGNRENQAFVDLNDDVLLENGGAWDAPPKKAIWNSEQLEKARSLITQNLGQGPFGFKDPRTLLVVSGWKQAFPAIEFVGVVRHPNVVARSLQNRSDMPEEKALALWYDYNSVLLQEHKKSAFPILCFDEEEEEFHQKLEKVVLNLALPDVNGEQKFYDDSLKTSNNDKQQLDRAMSWKVRRLYSRLLKRCV